MSEIKETLRELFRETGKVGYYMMYRALDGEEDGSPEA